MNGTRESATLRSGIREIITLTSRESGYPLTRIYFLTPRKASGEQAFQHSGGGRAVQRHSSYCVAMKIISEAKLPICQKSSVAQRVTRHLRLLRQLKCLTAAKTPTVLDYPRNFGNAAKDGLKRTTRWAVYYFTNVNSSVSCTQTCHDPVGHTRNSTVTTSTGDSTEHMEDGGLGVNICCSSASALSQTGNKDGNSWKSPFVSMDCLSIRDVIF